MFRKDMAQRALCSMAFGLILTASATADLMVQQNMAFTAKKQSPYGPDGAFEISKPAIRILTQPLPFNSGPVIDINAWDAVLGGLLPSDLLPDVFSLKAGFGINGSNNLDFGFYATGGRLDVTYPASSNLNFQTSGDTALVFPNQSYSIGSQFLPGVSQRTIPSQFWNDSVGPGGPELWLNHEVTTDGGVAFFPGPAPPTISTPSFAVYSPYASAWLDSSIDVRVGAYVEVEALGGLIDARANFGFGAGASERIAEIDPSGLYIAGTRRSDVSLTDPIPISVPILGVGTAELRLPDLALASGAPQGTLLSGQAVKPVLTVTADLEKLIPGLGPFLTGNVGPFGYSLINVNGGPQVGLTQNMTFEPDPKVRFQFSEPVLVQGTVVDGVVVAGPGDYQATTQALMTVEGGNLDWRPMFSNSSTITVSPTYLLDNTFTTKVGFDVSLVGRARALELDLPDPFPNVGPLIDESFTQSLFRDEEALFSEHFQVPINDVIGKRVTLEKNNSGFVSDQIGDLKLSRLVFRAQNPDGSQNFDLEFTQLIRGDRVFYNAPNVALRWEPGWNGVGENPLECGSDGGCYSGPDSPNENLYYVLNTLGDVVLTDRTTGSPINLGRSFLQGSYDLTSLLPEESPGYFDPLFPDLGTLYTNTLPVLPNTDIDTAGHAVLGGFNGLGIDATHFQTVDAAEVVDRRNGATTAVMFRTADLTPEVDAQFGYIRFASINNSGQVAAISNLVPFVPDPTYGSSIPSVYLADSIGKRNLVRADRPLPGGSLIQDDEDGIFASVVNNSGEVALVDGNFGSYGVFRAAPDEVVVIAHDGQSSPDGNGAFDGFGADFGRNGRNFLNNSHQVAFVGFLKDTAGGHTDETGIYRGDGVELSLIARKGQTAPMTTERFTHFNGPIQLNEAGQVAFPALTDSVRQGIYRGDGTSLETIALAGDIVPHGESIRRLYGSDLSLNNSGEVAFLAELDAAPVNGEVVWGIYRGNGVQLAEITRVGQLAPDQDGTFSLFDGIDLNDANQVAFLAYIDGTADYGGLYLGDENQITQVVRRGTAAPDGNGEFSGTVYRPDLNQHGQVAFNALLESTTGGISDDTGIFVFDGTNVVQVARKGQPLAGSTIVSFSDMPRLNDGMQVAYGAALADGREVVARFDPSLYWKTPGGGAWETDENWSLGVDPLAPYDALIIAEQALAVTGPAVSGAARSLVLGGDFTAEATLDLVAGSTLAVAEGALIRANGVLRGQGSIVGDVLNDGGVISPGNSPGTLFFDGNFQQGPMGRLLLEIMGPAAGTEYDLLDVTGSLILAGEIDIDFLNGYVPEQGTRFNLLQYGENFDASQANFAIHNLPAGIQLTTFVQNGVFGLQIGVPEPQSVCLILMGLGICLSRQPQRVNYRTA